MANIKIKHILLKALLISVFPCTGVQAQSLQDLVDQFNSSHSGRPVLSIIADAVKPALSIVRQQYRVEQGGKYYGRRSRPYYGESFSLRVKVSGSSFLQRNVIYPWENDEDFKRLNQGKKYEPSIYYTYNHAVSDSIWTPVDLELETQFVQPFDSDSLIYKHDDAVNDFGLAIDDTPGKKQGYMIWAYSSTTATDSLMKVYLRQNSMPVDAKGNSALIKLNPSDSEKVIGGIYVVPVVERVGQIKVLLAGIATKKTDGSWALFLLTEEDGSEDELDEPDKMDTRQKHVEPEGNPADDDLDLTPIN